MKNKDRKTFKFDWHGNFITNCHVNTYGVAVRRNGDLGISSAREQFACLVFDDPEMDESEFVQRFDGGDEFHKFLADELYVCNDNDLLDRPGRDLADELEYYFQLPAAFANTVERWLQAKSEFPELVESWLRRELRNKQEAEIKKLQEECRKKFQIDDQKEVDKILLNTYLNDMFK